MATFDDLTQLSNLFQQSYSPVTNYGQGLLALAMERRKRAEQQMDLAQQQAFTLQRDQAQAALQERLEKSAHDAASQRMKLAWEHADSEEKDKILRDLRAQAKQMGLPTPAASLTKDEQADYYNTTIGKAHAEKALNLINSSRKLQEQFSQETGTDPRERIKHQIDVLLANPASLVLTPKERIDLQNDPSILPNIVARLQRDRSAKGKQAADDFVLASSAANEATDLFYAKYAKNPERVAQIVGDLGLMRQALTPILSSPNLPPGLYADIFSSVGSATKQIQAEQKPNKFALPPPPPARAASPSQAAVFAAPETATPGGFLTQGVVDAARATPGFVNKLIFPSTTPAPAAATDPSVQSKLRLQKFLQDSAAQNPFPLAFPPYNTNQFTAPLSPNPAP